MPELPEIEAVARSIAPIVVGRGLEVVRTGCHDMRARGTGRRMERGRRWITRGELLHGSRISRIERHGKRLGIVADDGRCLVVQLGMSGQLIAGDGCGEDHVHVEWSVTGGKGIVLLRFRDPRRFGGLTPYADRASMLESWRSELGPDALNVTDARLAAAVTGARPVKAMLLDQRSIAGVGNIYADESLHLAGIDPRTRCDRMPADAVHSLAAAIRTVLAKAVRSGGSTLRDHRLPDGRKGRAQRLHAVYGRSGEPCLRCGTRLRHGTVAGRTTVWCPRCQRRS